MPCSPRRRRRAPRWRAGEPIGRGHGGSPAERRRARTDRAGVDRRAAGAAAGSGCSGPCSTPTSASSTTRRAFDAAGVHPDDCRELADLARFPFTTKADLREQYPFGMFAVPREQIVRIHASSGTTGRPTVVGSTADDSTPGRGSSPARSAPPAAARATASTTPTATACSPVASGSTAGAERLGCMVIPVSGGMTERQVLLIRDLEPEVIMATPSYMLVIVDEIERQGIDPRSTSLQVGIFGAEPWTDDMRARAGGAARHARHRHVRAVGGDGPRCGVRVHRDQGRTAPLGGPLLPGDHRPGHRRGARRRRGGRAGPHLAHPTRHADDPLPDPRPHPAAARARPGRCGGSARSPAAPTT